jgi:hypothetical protein
MVTLDTSVFEAARLLAEQDLPRPDRRRRAGLPSSILPGTQVLRLAVPGYRQDDPALGRVIDGWTRSCRRRLVGGDRRGGVRRRTR